MDLFSPSLPIFCKHIQPAHLQPDAQGISDTADMSSS